MKRDIPDYNTKPHVPGNPQSWYKAYKKLKKEASKESSDALKALEATLSGIKNAKEQNTAEVASSAVGAALWERTDAPGPSRRARQVYGYMSGKTGSKGASKMTVMQKIRKEARGSGPSLMARPMHELKKKYHGVTTAPVSFVEDVKRMKVLQQVDNKKAAIAFSGRGIGISRASAAPWDLPPKHLPQPAAVSGVEPYDLTNDREARLQALKSGKSLPPMPPRPVYDPKTVSNNVNGSLTLDFLETDSSDESAEAKKPAGKRQREEIDGLFDEIKKPSMKRARDDVDDLFDDKPSKKSQREEDDELFGTVPRPSRKRHAISDDDDDDISPPPKISKISPPAVEAKVSPPLSKHPKPLSAQNETLRPMSRTGSPLRMSPANSPRLQATKMKKREAPSLFMKRK